MEGTLSQFQGMKSALIMFEEKNKKLMGDNQEYVKQMIAMKESRAQLMNDCLSGKMNADVSNNSVSSIVDLSHTLLPSCLMLLLKQMG